MSVNKEEVVFEQRVQLEIVLLYFHCTSESFVDHILSVIMVR